MRSIVSNSLTAFVEFFKRFGAEYIPDGSVSDSDGPSKLRSYEECLSESAESFHVEDSFLGRGFCKRVNWSWVILGFWGR